MRLCFASPRVWIGGTHGFRVGLAKRFNRWGFVAGRKVMKSIVVRLFAAVLCGSGVPLAVADCYKDGQAYPAGTVIDGFVCTTEGTWEKA